MTSLAEAFRLGRGCFGREGVLRCTGTFPGSYRVLGRSAESWLAMQDSHDLWQARQRLDLSGMTLMALSPPQPNQSPREASRSTSLPGFAWSLATDPKTATLLAPKRPRSS